MMTLKSKGAHSSSWRCKNHSIESYVVKVFVILNTLLISLLMLTLYLLGVAPFHLLILSVFVVLLSSTFVYRFRTKLLVAFERAQLHIEAIKAEDYNQYSKSEFSQGAAQDLHLGLKELTRHLQKNKARYDQHAFLLYQLIDQLNTPIMVFNKNHQLTYANGAFSSIYDQPWQMYRLATPNLLGLTQTDTGWQLPSTGQQWQISESEFIDDDEAHHLFVCTNIDSAVRASQHTAWQQMIRVMGHEIRNSLTPVSSLAESLATKVDGQREQQALQLISERCHHLQDFINRYASVSQRIELNKTQLDLSALWQGVMALYPELEFSSQIGVTHIYADESFLQQVLINLVKNSKEAEASKLVMSVKNKSNGVQIKLEDNGHGFLNPDNMFVPLYTTKQDGQGIGLTFCRTVIEAHQGKIQLTNRAELEQTQGVSVTLSLPQLPRPHSFRPEIKMTPSEIGRLIQLISP